MQSKKEVKNRTNDNDLVFGFEQSTTTYSVKYNLMSGYTSISPHAKLCFFKRIITRISNLLKRFLNKIKGVD